MVLERIARRLIEAVAVLVLASLIAFAILDVTPGDAAQRMIGESASTEELETLRETLGLNRALPLRYLDYLAGAVRGNLGKSLINGRPVTEMIGERFANTLLLACVSTLVAASLGVFVGLWSAARRGSWADLGAMSAMALSVALPNFGLALLLTLLFSLKLRLLPVAGGGSPAHLVLPVITLALPMMAVVARMSRSSLLDASQAEYTLAAQARGVSSRKLWRKHILKNALVPVITLVGLNFGHLLGGAFVVETIFGWPGLGRMIVQAVFDQDYPLILGAVLLLAVIFQTFNLIIDLLHGWLDPRVGSEAL